MFAAETPGPAAATPIDATSAPSARSVGPAGATPPTGATPSAPSTSPSGRSGPAATPSPTESPAVGVPTGRTPIDLATVPVETTPGPPPGAAGPPTATVDAAEAARQRLHAQPQRVAGRRPRVRRVTRVVRHVDPWSVFKVALIFNVLFYGILLTAGVLLWNVAYATGTVDNLERFMESFGWTDFEFHGDEIFRSAWVAGLFIVVGLTGLAVLAATMFNLITDLVGGVRLTVLEEEVVERQSGGRNFLVRRRSGPPGPPSRSTGR